MEMAVAVAEAAVIPAEAALVATASVPTEHAAPSTVGVALVRLIALVVAAVVVVPW